mgnify:CR=1 FL=1
MPSTILSEAGATVVQPALVGGDALWLTPSDLAAATGWTIRPEGLCRGDVCIPVPAGKRAEFVRDGAVNVSAFWRCMGAPVAVADAGDVWALGAPAATRAAQLESLEAASDLERIRLLFDDIERKEELITLLDKARDAQGVRLFIGAENPLFSLSGSSVIVAPYMNAEQEIIGALGVIGPTRLNYARVIPLVDYTARVVGKILDGARSRE